MPASKSSPDGSQQVDQLVVAGRTYDLPPWLNAQEFETGLASNNDENPLASLIACELVDWELNEDFDAEEPELGPEYRAIFRACWALPYGSIRELVAGIFTPQLPADLSAPMFTIEFDAHGATLEALVIEYRDITDVQVYLLPEPITEFVYTPSSGTDEYNYLAELLEEFQADPDEFIGRVSGPGIDGQVAHTVTQDGVPHVLVLNFHED